MTIRVLLSRVSVLVFGVGLPLGAALAANVGDAAPTFALTGAHGDEVSLETLRGKVVYVDFWASWCGPCRRSFPWMNEMHRRYAAQGLVIVAIDVDKNRADGERFLTANAAEFAIAYDPDGVTPNVYGVTGMPSSYLIDTAGKLIDIEQGFHDDRKAPLEQRIRQLLAAGRT